MRAAGGRLGLGPGADRSAHRTSWQEGGGKGAHSSFCLQPTQTDKWFISMLRFRAFGCILTLCASELSQMRLSRHRPGPHGCGRWPTPRRRRPHSRGGNGVTGCAGGGCVGQVGLGQVA